MAESRCFFDACAEPAVKGHLVSVDGVDHQLQLCSEHFHDVDWEVIGPDELRDRVRVSLQGDLGTHDAA